MKYETYVAYRDAKGTTDHQISKACSIPKSTFCAWRQGRYTPKTDKLLKIAMTLDIPTALILEPDVTKEERRRMNQDGEPNDSG